MSAKHTYLNRTFAVNTFRSQLCRRQSRLSNEELAVFACWGHVNWSFRSLVPHITEAALPHMHTGPAVPQADSLGQPQPHCEGGPYSGPVLKARSPGRTSWQSELPRRKLLMRQLGSEKF